MSTEGLSLNARVERIEGRLDGLDAKTSALELRIVSQAKSPSGGEIASDDVMDSKFGNQPIRKDPSAKYWDGTSYVGVPFSECPPEYLDAMAKYKDACAYMNEKSGDQAKAKYIGYDRKDAALARGWAARIRKGGYVPKVPVEPEGTSFDDQAPDEIPF